MGDVGLHRSPGQLKVCGYVRVGLACGDLLGDAELGRRQCAPSGLGPLPESAHSHQDAARTQAGQGTPRIPLGAQFGIGLQGLAKSPAGFLDVAVVASSTAASSSALPRSERRPSSRMSSAASRTRAGSARTSP